MCFQKCETSSYCVAGRHRSVTLKNVGDITSEGSKIINGDCSMCNKKYMTVSDYTRAAERLGDFFQSLGKKSLNA